MHPLWKTSKYKVSPLYENLKDTNIDENNKKRTLLMEKIINEFGYGSMQSSSILW